MPSPRPLPRSTSIKDEPLREGTASRAVALLGGWEPGLETSRACARAVASTAPHGLVSQTRKLRLSGQGASPAGQCQARSTRAFPRALNGEGGPPPSPWKNHRWQPPICSLPINSPTLSHIGRQGIRAEKCHLLDADTLILIQCRPPPLAPPSVS